MSLAILAPPLSSRSGPATLRSRFAQSFLGVAALVLAMACGGGGGGGGGSTTPVVPPPVATSLTASSLTPAYGNTFTLTPVYSAGTGTIDNGVTCPATGIPSAPISANWSGARTFTLTVTNSANVTATTKVDVTPQITVSIDPISPANPSVTVSTPITFTTSVTGGKDNTFRWSSSNNAGTWAGNVWTAPNTPGDVTITATADEDHSKTATTVVTVKAAVALPTTPVVTAPAKATAGKTGLTASVPPQAGCTYAWAQTGGATITAGETTNAITWTAPASGSVRLTCTVTNEAGSTPGSSNPIPVVAAATQPTVTAPAKVTVSKTGLAASVPTQTGCTYAWSQTGGATITAGSTTNAITWNAPSSGSVVLSCIVTNAAGDPATAGTANVDVVAAPQVIDFSATPGTITSGTAAMLHYQFSGRSGSIDHGIDAVTSGGSTGTGNLTASTTYRLTVTNDALDTDFRDVTVTVVPAPTITSFTSTGLQSNGSGATLTAVFDAGPGGSAEISQANSSVFSNIASNTPLSLGTLTGDKTYVLTVTNAAGATVSAALTVTVLPVFTLHPAPKVLIDGSTATFTVAVSSTATLTEIAWERSDNQGGTWANVSTGNTSTSFTTPSLSADPLTGNNGVLFRAIARNSFGTTTSMPAGVNVALPVAIGSTSSTIDLVKIPAGTFTMGEDESPVIMASEAHSLNPHAVTFVTPFYMAKVPITQAQWEAVMGSNPSSGSHLGATRPVDTVSYNDITAAGTGFLAMLNAATLSSRPPSSFFRLPTDAEYEYALRAGTRGQDNYFFGSHDAGVPNADVLALIDKYMWSKHNSGGTTHPVSDTLPNPWGLYDMIGNVWQVCEDDWHTNYQVTPGPAILLDPVYFPDDTNPRTVPILPLNGAAWIDTERCNYRVLRGGDFDVSQRYGQSKIRGPYARSYKDWNTGLRVVLQLP